MLSTAAKKEDESVTEGYQKLRKRNIYIFLTSRIIEKNLEFSQFDRVLKPC